MYSIHIYIYIYTHTYTHIGISVYIRVRGYRHDYIITFKGLPALQTITFTRLPIEIPSKHTKPHVYL